MTVRLYVEQLLRPGLEFDLPTTAARHVQVRRLQPADRLVLFDGRGGEWTASVLHMGRSRVAVRAEAFAEVERESATRVVVAVGMPANERMDLLVEKATELGVAAIQPLLCTRSVLRVAADRAARKREHWQAIAAAASEQCGRTRVPPVAPVLAFERWLATLVDDGALRVVLSPTAAAPLPAVAGAAAALLVLSGPEGGLAPDEEAAARAHGFVAAQLGARVLRAETAPLAVLAWAALRGDPACRAASA
jgi:16S rRNA (uracil1498-N3)-methyltransferase